MALWNLGRTRRRTQFRFAATCSFILMVANPGQLNAQQPANIVAEAGNAAVTAFSGSLPPIQIAPGVDPNLKTFIDPNGPSLRVVDLQHMGGLPTAQLVGAPKPFTFSAAMVGQVFGVAVDDHSPPNIYAAATSAYGLPIVAPGSDGRSQHVQVGAANATFMSGLWGPQGGPGSIWKIDGMTGRVTLFANVTLGSRTNSGAALGGLAFDADSKSLFVADRETGFIHRFGTDGRELGRYEHGIAGRAAQGLPPVEWNARQRIDLTSSQFDSAQPETWHFATPKRRVFALAVYQHRLYYAVADGLQIWSVGVKDDGGFNDDAVIELVVPPASGPTEISKITFDEQGRMFLAERAAPTGAFDFVALAVPTIGRVLRYSLVGTTPNGRHIWREQPDEYAIGFPGDLRNSNGGVAIGYNYDRNGEIIHASCGGFMWSTGEDLRNSSDAALDARLIQSGPLHVDGLQGNGTWRIKRNSEPPLESYFIDYIDEFQDEAARGHMGDIAIARTCTPPIETYPTQPPRPPAGAPPIRHGKPGAPPGGSTPPGGTTPPGGCLPNQLRDANTGICVPNCPRPSIQVSGKCCQGGELVANAVCSNSNCPSNQTAIGPSNFCCNSSQVYIGANGGQACCSGSVVNGRCQPSTTPPPSACAPSPTNPCCGNGYVPSGGSCCLASQMTSTGMCCPSGQVPSGPNQSQCKPPKLIPIGPRCCSAGQIPAVSQPCCAAANVTTAGICCSQPVDPRDRTQCPAQIQITPMCAAGYTKMPNGTCCNHRFVGADGRSCKSGARPCPAGQFRDKSGACSPIVPRMGCGPGEALTPGGECVPMPPIGCPSGEVLSRHGDCIPIKPPPVIAGHRGRHHPSEPPRRREPGQPRDSSGPPHDPVFRSPVGRRGGLFRSER
jgi:hypothetical protein